ncbi:EF-hand domain-containing protein [Sphingomicrobium marinum]|uniref:hypothetical protein n=1 Tax=Sphingomicrobium marinum TaxID=1227950 RepID=UPI00223F8A54|nr:hypothetical protein [Sphingomicrobium marinum]
MARIAAGIAAILFIAAGIFMLTRSNAAADEPRLEDTPPPELVQTADAPRELPVIPELGEPPKADPLTKEEKRFNRVDRDRNDLISLAEIVQPRRSRFAKLDLDGDGVLRFEEWAITTIDKFEGADADGNGQLTRAEYATTAPKPRKPKPKCSC